MSTSTGNETSTQNFDPASELFVAQSQRPVSLTDVDFKQLSPLLRALLVTDGTVTKLLEAWSLEPVSVRVLDQANRHLEAADDHLGLDQGDEVIKRSVMLVGTESQRLYLFAESLIVPASLPTAVREKLNAEPGGLGKILLDSRLETRREGLWFGCERAAQIPAPVAALCDGEFVTRSYRIIAGDKPLMRITERFPAALGNTPPADTQRA